MDRTAANRNLDKGLHPNSDDDQIRNSNYQCSDEDENWSPTSNDGVEKGQSFSATIHPRISNMNNDISTNRATTGQHQNFSMSDEDGEVEEDTTVARSAEKRKYTYTNRSKKCKQGPKRRHAWILNLDRMSEAKLRRTTCCKKLKCFKVVNYDYLMERSRYVLSATTHTRRTILSSMLGSNDSFYFNGKIVCVMFLKKSFKYSTELIAEIVTNSRKRETLQNQNNIRSNDQTQSRSSNDQPSSISGTVSSPMKAFKREAVISFLRRIGEDCSEQMPDKNEIHIPFFQKQHVYNKFVEEFKKLYQSEEPPTSPYFLRVWKKECSDIKVRKATRFTVCDVCEQLRAALHEALMKGLRTDEIVKMKSEHVKFVSEERMVYQQKRDRARLDSSRFCSIIVDGADQSSFGLPHFSTCVKSQRGHALKVKLVGILEHDIQNVLHLSTMTEDHATGANHIVEAIHRFLKERRARSPLPKTFFVQLDNCSRENKNKYLMSYFETLVSLGVFQTVEIGFLPVGHTHEDIDRCFSETSCRLRANNAITLENLHYELSQTNRLNTKVSHLKRIVNWSGLCDKERNLRKIDNITQFRYFKFSPAFSEKDDLSKGPLSTQCHVKHKCNDVWRKLFHVNNSESSFGILRRCPDLRQTPSLIIKCPDGYNEVTKRIESEETRVNCPDKMKALYDLRDFVFKDRVDAFHWDLVTSVETEHYDFVLGDEHIRHVSNTSSTERKSTRINLDSSRILPSFSGTVESQNAVPQAQTNTVKENKIADPAKPKNKFSYEVGSFVILRTENDDIDDRMDTGKQFWVGKVVNIINQNGENYVRLLKVHWYDIPEGKHKEQDPIVGQFYPCYQPTSALKRRNLAINKHLERSDLRQPWTDEVDTDTVLICFDCLTIRNTLPLNVQKKLTH